MSYRLGPHAILLNEAARSWAQGAPIVKGLNIAILQSAPVGATQVFRQYIKDQRLDDAVGTANAILGGLAGYRHPNLYVEVWNEAHPTLAQLRAVTNLLHSAGIKVAGGSYSTGDYTALDWETVVQAGCDAIAVHCYWGAKGFTLDHALRYRQFWEDGDPSVIITECGRDAIEGGKGGWHKDGIGEDAYVAELVQYAQEISKDAYVLGATPFTAAPTPNWQAFETDSITPKLIAALGGNVPDPANNTNYTVGPGVLARMAEQNDKPATNEVYWVPGAPWSETVGVSGKVYRYVKSLNYTFVYRPD